MIEVDKLSEEVREKFKEDLQKYGEGAVSHFLYTDHITKLLKCLNLSSTDFVWFVVTLQFIDLFGSKDPSSIHFASARECLNEQNIENNKAVDMLARSLVIECQNFRDSIFKKFKINDRSIALDNAIVKMGNNKGWLIPEYDAHPEFVCSQDNCNAFDLAFSDFLEKIGPCGKESSKIIKESSPTRYQNYINSSYHSDYRPEAWSVWISKEQPFLVTPFLSILTNAIWNDKCKQKWEKEKSNIPALTQAVLVTTIKPPLSKDTKIEVTNETTITCYSEKGNVILRVPCVDHKLVKLICKGMQCLSSLNGHKLIRWQVKTGFCNWASGLEDPRLICTSGGYEGIANLIGCGNSNKTSTEVKAMLQAQAYGQFAFPNGGSGNMIILREMEKHKNGEPSKINIILGEFLLPNFTHLLPPGEKRRLVPITELPPLIGSKNTHAAQAMLQLLILEEFTKQSDKLATHGSIQITAEKWEELAREAKLPKSSLNNVIIGWTHEDLFSKAFLKKYGDEYTLGQEHSNVIEFLEYQGKQRIEGAKGGEKSAFSKKNSIQKKYSKRKS